MPQVDIVTFLPIVFWTFVIYTGGFLFLNSTTLYTFISSMKFAAKRGAQKYNRARQSQALLARLTVFPWIVL